MSESEDWYETELFHQVLPDVRKIGHNSNIMLPQGVCRSDARQHQQFRRV